MADKSVVLQEAQLDVNEAVDATEALTKLTIDDDFKQEDDLDENGNRKSWADICEEEEEVTVSIASALASVDANGVANNVASASVVDADSLVTSIKEENPAEHLSHMLAQNKTRPAPVTNAFDALSIGGAAEKQPIKGALRRRPRKGKISVVRMDATVSTVVVSSATIPSTAPTSNDSANSMSNSAPSTSADASRSYAAAAGGSASVSSFNTTSVRVFEPTDMQIYNALKACGMIRVNPQPPESFRNGTDAQVAIYNAFYKNPRGIRSRPVKDTVYSCWKTTVTCLYAKLIAIIYELAGHVATEEAISSIDFYDFSSMYHELVSRTGNHWFGVYPIFRNAQIHIETFCHQCAHDCPVAHIQRELRNVDARDRQIIQDHIIDHMAMYKHPAHPGPPGRPPRNFAPSSMDNGSRNRRERSRDRRGRSFRERPYQFGAHSSGHSQHIPDVTDFPGISIKDTLNNIAKSPF